MAVRPIVDHGPYALPIIIGIAGCANAGKNLSATILATHFHRMGKLRTTEVAFADGVREECWDLNESIALSDGTSVPYRTILGMYAMAKYRYQMNLQGEWKPAYMTFYNEAKRVHPQIREYLVRRGQQRRNENPNYWRDLLIPRSFGALREKYPDTEVLIFTDVRQRNEATAIQDMGGTLIYVERPGVRPADATEEASLKEVESLPGVLRLRNDGSQSDLSNYLQPVAETAICTMICRMCWSPVTPLAQLRAVQQVADRYINPPPF